MATDCIVLFTIAGHRKGISRSAKPYRRSAPSWLKATAPNVIDQISKMAKKGMTPSQIGVMLRDSHGIAQVKAVTGSKILRILKSQGKPALALPSPHSNKYSLVLATLSRETYKSQSA